MRPKEKDQEQVVALGHRPNHIRAELGKPTVYVTVDQTSYLTRPDLRRAAERMVQIVVECAFDIAEAVLEAAGRAPPSTARAAFEGLGELGVVGPEVAMVFGRRYVGLSNRIVHDYERIDNERVRAGGLELLEDAARFGRDVSAWLDRGADAYG